MWMVERLEGQRQREGVGLQLCFVDVARFIYLIPTNLHISFRRGVYLWRICTNGGQTIVFFA